MKSKVLREDYSILAWLYDVYRNTYPQSQKSIQSELENVYRELFGKPLENAEKIATVVLGMFDEHARYVYESGVQTGVQLALDLELESMMYRGDGDVFDC